VRWEIAPPKSDDVRTCVFCDTPADSYEHVIPAWISKRLGIKTFLSADDAFVTAEALRRRQPISFANYRARVFCSGCNEHFKHLEDAVIPLLVPMARGMTLSLDVQTQTQLALWAHKTAIALCAAGSDTQVAVPQQHRTAIRDGGVPRGIGRLTTLMTSQGSVPTGPSEQYLKLLKGELSPEEYAKGVKKRVRAERKNGSSGGGTKNAAQRKPA
jgi:hypothetical protein